MKYKNPLKPTVIILLSLILLFAFSACSQNDGSSEIPDPPADSDETIDMVSGDYQFVVNHDNTITITKYTGQDISIEILGEIDGKKVTAIGNTSKESGAFQDSTTLVSVVIPDGVTEIQDNAFQGCTSLKTVKVPASVIHLGNYAFYNCPELTTVYFEGDAPQNADNVFVPETHLAILYREGTEGWTNPWYDCSALTYLESGEYYYKVNDDNTATITKYIGKGGDAVIPTEINGMKVTAIGNTPGRIGAFEYCTTLTSVVIPEGVTEIQDNAFYYCTMLTSVVIPEGVTKIQDNAFYSCHSLKMITIPASVTVIWHCAFADCPNLQSVYFEGDAPQTGNYLFDLTFPTIYYHEGSDGWTNPWYGRATEIY